MSRSTIRAGVAATLLVASFAVAQAQQPMQRVQVGVLECRGGASIGFIVGSVTNLGCVLRVEGLPDDRYIATVRKVGPRSRHYPGNRRWPGGCSRRWRGLAPATSPAITPACREVRRSASGSAATR